MPSEDSIQHGHPSSLISLRCPHEKKLGSLTIHWEHREDSDQTWLIRVFAGRTVILLVLSCCVSFLFCLDYVQVCDFTRTRATGNSWLSGAIWLMLETSRCFTFHCCLRHTWMIFHDTSNPKPIYMHTLNPHSRHHSKTKWVMYCVERQVYLKLCYCTFTAD